MPARMRKSITISCPGKTGMNRKHRQLTAYFTLVGMRWAAESLLKASGVLGTPAYLRAGTQVLDHLWRENWTSDRGMAHMLGDSGNQPPVLADQVYCIRAFLTLYQTTGHQKHLRRAITVVRTVQRLFGSPDGGFYDIAEEKTPAWGMLPKEKSVLENSLLAEALISLARLTGECEYLGLARNALEAFAGVVPGSSYLGPDDSHRMEEDEEQLFLPAGAAWARAWDMLNRGPVHLVLVGDTSNSSTKRLWEAALKTYAPHRITQVLDPERDADRLASLGFPTERGDALYACIGDMCLAPITSSKDVRELERSRPWASR